MKRIVLSALFLMVSIIGYGQLRHLKGPAAKNYQNYLSQESQTNTAIVTSDQEPAQGPAAKNPQYHKHNNNGAYQNIGTIAEYSRPMGPQAKQTRKSKKYLSAARTATVQTPQSPKEVNLNKNNKP